MPTEQPTTTPTGGRFAAVHLHPPHETIEQRITRVREGLEVIFGEILTAHDVCITVYKGLVQQNGEQDGDLANVLRRCGSDKLHEQLHELNDVIEDIGGRTSFSDDPEDEQAAAPIAAVVLKVGDTEGGDNE
jgi:hypothetical protein